MTSAVDFEALQKANQAQSMEGHVEHFFKCYVPKDAESAHRFHVDFYTLVRSVHMDAAAQPIAELARLAALKTEGVLR